MTVTPIRADLGPPSTDFEREAVETLIGGIRKMVAETGCEPNGVAFVTFGHLDREDGRKLATRTGWFNEKGETQARLALAGLCLSDAAQGRR